MTGSVLKMRDTTALPTAPSSSGPTPSLINLRPLTPSPTANPAPVVGDGIVFSAPLRVMMETSGFGPRAAPAEGASTNHRGQDFSGRVNIDANDTVVRSVAPSFVVWVGELRGLGWSVLAITVPDGDAVVGLAQSKQFAQVAVLYGHLGDMPSVRPGDLLVRGEKVGEIGQGAGSSGEKRTGPHLHLGVLERGGKDDGWLYVDPAKYFTPDAQRKNTYRTARFGYSNFDDKIKGLLTDTPRRDSFIAFFKDPTQRKTLDTGTVSQGHSENVAGLSSIRIQKASGRANRVEPRKRGTSILPAANEHLAYTNGTAGNVSDTAPDSRSPILQNSGIFMEFRPDGIRSIER